MIQIFERADLPFNALLMLLNISSKIHDFHGAVDSMLEEVSSYLGQLSIVRMIAKHGLLDRAWDVKPALKIDSGLLENGL
jgi:hypothetical protein